MDAERWEREDDGDWVARYEPDALSIEPIDDGAKRSDTSSTAHEVSTSENENHTQHRAVLGDQCPICLHSLDDPVMIQGCHHVYCLACLSSWVRNQVLHGRRETTCPLCKRVFHSAYADVVSENEYEIIHFDGRASRRNKSSVATDGAQRRAMVYANRMRLVRVNGVDVSNVGGDETLSAPVKSSTREFSEWLDRELRACVGPHVDLVVLRALIDSVIGTPMKREINWRLLHDTLAPFLLDDTAIFVREFAFFLGSRLNMLAYDGVLEYCCASDSTNPCTIASCVSNHSL